MDEVDVGVGGRNLSVMC